MGKTQARRKTAAKPKVTAKPKSSPVKKASAKTAGAKKFAAASKKKAADTPFITTLTIENFKSIMSMQLNPKRVNVFIGEPNSGKTNILEALGLQSVGGITENFYKKILRVRNIFELFYNQNSEKDIHINNNLYDLIFETQHYSDGSFSGKFELTIFGHKHNTALGSIYASDLKFISGEITKAQKNKFNNEIIRESHISNILFYKFDETDTFNWNHGSFLNPPYGDNFIHLLIINKDLRASVSSTLASVGLDLRVIQNINQIEITEKIDGINFVYPFASLSQTIRRQIFYSTILATCKQKVILFDEPDTHAFPPYVKQFAEEIAFQKSNQFFITTHNPYMLGSLVEKTPTKELAVFICRKENNQTKVYELNEEQILQVMDYDVDVFFNLDRIIGL
jgi:AAA15 family ATPase/GTPase